MEAMPQLSSAAEQEDEGFSLDLGNNRLASVKIYKGQTQVDLREHYEKDGDLAPGARPHWPCLTVHIARLMSINW